MASHYFLISDDQRISDMLAAALAIGVSPMDVVTIPAPLIAAPEWQQRMATLTELRP